MINFLHTFIPQPIFWQMGPLVIRNYGLIITLAIFAGVMTAIYLAKRQKMSVDDLLDVVFYAVIFGIIGARLYEVIVLEPRYFFANPTEIIKIWHGGLAIHGAIIAGVLTVIVWCRFKHQDFWRWADLAVIVLPLAQAIGRWGNYFNQEVFGRPTSLAWGIPIEIANRPVQYINDKYFHPTFLYELILDLLLFTLLFTCYRKQQFMSGQYLGLYLIGYGLIRFLMEFMRSDQTAIFFGYRWPQIFSLVLIVIGIIIINRKKLASRYNLK